MTDASIVLGIDGRPAQQGAAQVKGALNEVKGTAQQSKKAVDANTKAFDDLKKTTFGLTGALKGLIAGFGVRELLRYSDAWKSLEGRLSIVTRSTNELRNVQQKLFDVSQRTRASFESTANLYVKLAQSSRTLGKSQEDMLRFTELVNKGFAISGASATEVAGAVRQLSQAMASGVLRGDEFNSIMENAPRLQQALAQSLNVSVGELRKMAEQGELTARKVFDGVMKQGQAFDQEFKKIPVTVSQALQQIDNAFLKFIGQSKVIAAGSSSIAFAIGELANNFSILADTVTVTAAIFGGVYLAKMGAAITITEGMALATAGLSLAMRAIPFVAIVGGIVYLSDKFGGLGSVLDLAVLSLKGFVGMLLKMGNTVQAVARGVLAGFSGMFSRVGSMFDAFTADMADFVSNPFGAGGFTRLKSEMDKGFNDAFMENFAKVYDESRAFSENIDKNLRMEAAETFERIKNRQSDAAGSTIDFAAANQDLKDALKDTNSALKDTAKESAKAGDAIQILQEQADPIAEIFKNTAESIRDSFRGAIRDSFDGPGGFKSMKDRILSTFKDMLADMITLAIANPIIVPVVQGIGGALGLSSGSINAVTGQLGGGGVSNGVDVLSGVGKLMPNTWKQSILSTLGFGSTAATMAATAGATAAGGLATAGALSAGGSAAVAAGGVAGTAGLSLGAILPVAGLALGALSLFGGLGGLFGGKPSAKTQAVGLDIASGAVNYLPENSLTGKKFSQENLDAAKQLAATGKQLINIISGDNGGLSGMIKFFVSSRDGSGFQINNESINSYKDPGEFVKALTRAIMDGSNGVPETMKTAFEKIDFSKAKESLEDVFNDIAFAMNFDKIGEAPETISQVKAALEALQDEFDNYRKTAERLGLSVEKVNEAEQKRLQIMRSAFNSQIQNQLLGATAPLTLLINEENKRYEQELEDAKLLGADLEAVNMLHRLNVELIKEQSRESSAVYQNLVKQQEEARDLVNSFSQISDNLGNFIREMRVGSLSPLSPGAKLAEARASFMSAADRAALGDRDAAGQLTGLAQTFLQLSRSYNASTQAFDQDFAIVQDKLQRAKEVADRQVSIQQSLLDTANAQLETTRSSYDKMIAIMSGNPLAAYGLKENPNDTLLRAMNTRDGQTYFGNVPMSAVDAIFARNGVNVVPGEGRRADFLNRNPAIAQAVAADFRAAGIPGFANGGSFTVGGSGGIDSRYVSFMATPGERVTVTKPSQGGDYAVLSKQIEQLTHVVAKGLGASNKRLGKIAQSTTEAAGQRRLAAN